MKLKQFQSVLQGLETFSAPKVELEQYATSAEIASVLLFQYAHLGFDDIAERSVADFGCGCGVFTCGMYALGARHCVGFDIDAECLETCSTNVASLSNGSVEQSAVDLVQCDLARSSNALFRPSVTPMFDCVLMNPPFGTRRKGIDAEFLESAIAVSSVVYSLHKSSTRTFIEKKAHQLGVDHEVLSQLRFDLPATYAFHRQAQRDIDVDLWRFERRS